MEQWTICQCACKFHAMSMRSYGIRRPAELMGAMHLVRLAATAFDGVGVGAILGSLKIGQRRSLGGSSLDFTRSPHSRRRGLAAGDLIASHWIARDDVVERVANRVSAVGAINPVRQRCRSEFPAHRRQHRRAAAAARSARPHSKPSKTSDNIGPPPESVQFDSVVQRSRKFLNLTDRRRGSSSSSSSSVVGGQSVTSRFLYRCPLQPSKAATFARAMTGR
jgi:hypothetical protein